ncbi:MAG: ComF family protein [Gemmatimonadota bacterium]|nr:ComF family protein [Gemmatimonadota bacterium]
MAPHAYEGSAARLVQAHKYGGWRSVAEPMATAMIEDARRQVALLASMCSEMVMTPVPLAASRLRERGFNQAQDLSTAVSGRLGVPHAELLERIPGTGHQAGSGMRRRRANVEGRFAVSRARGVAGDPVTGVLLVDDVLTTGATLLACAAALEEAGFRHIAALTFARTLRTSTPTTGPAPRFRRGME